MAWSRDLGGFAAVHAVGDGDGVEEIYGDGPVAALEYASG